MVQRNKIFADAFGRDPEFFSFYRAMQAYETALIGGDTSLILSPDSDFFKFFGNTGIINRTIRLFDERTHHCDRSFYYLLKAFIVCLISIKNEKYVKSRWKTAA